MPTFPQPWFRKGRGWYLTLHGQQIPLGTEEKAAFRRYHEIMAAPPEKPTPPPQADAVAVLLDRFLEWTARHRAADTYQWYAYRLQLFLNHAPRGLKVTELKPFHDQEWIDGMTTKSGSKRNCVRAVKRALAWCEEQGYLQHSPLCHMKKPSGGRR